MTKNGLRDPEVLWTILQLVMMEVNEDMVSGDYKPVMIHLEITYLSRLFCDYCIY